MTRTFSSMMFGSLLAVAAMTPTQSQAQSFMMCPQADSGSATLCLNDAQWNRIVEYRRQKGQSAKWRPWVCDQPTVEASTNCKMEKEFTVTRCATADGPKGHYVAYRRKEDKKWPDGANTISCKIK